MPLVTAQIPNSETTFLLPILSDAEEGEERIRAALFDPTCIVYVSRLDGQLAGGIAQAWRALASGWDSECIP